MNKLVMNKLVFNDERVMNELLINEQLMSKLVFSDAWEMDNEWSDEFQVMNEGMRNNERVNNKLGTVICGGIMNG